MKKQIKSKQVAKARLEALAHDAPLYRVVVEPPSRGPWPIEERIAERSLQALALFGIVQPDPLLLSLMRARTGIPKLKASQFNKTLEVIERFHFQYTIVSQLSSSGGVSEMYAKGCAGTLPSRG